MKFKIKLLPFVAIISLLNVALPNITACSQKNESEEFVTEYVMNGSSTEPEAWQNQYSPQVTGEAPEDWDYSKEYFAAAEKDKNILAGDIACSYYSAYASDSDIAENLEKVIITIKNADANSCTASYIAEDIPTSTCQQPEKYHVKMEVNNMPFCAQYIRIPSWSFTGWAIEPLPFILAGNLVSYLGMAEDLAIMVEVYYLWTSDAWSVKYTTYDAEGKEDTITWNRDSEIGASGTTNKYAIYYLVEHFINTYVISFRSHYLEVWNE